MSVFGESVSSQNNREEVKNAVLNGGNLNLILSNMGTFGKMEGNNYGLQFPKDSGINYLFKSSLWVGGKRYRKNDQGVQYYWLQYPPTNNSVVLEGDYTNGWDETLVPVIDTLVTVGFDGDLDLYELLPAYNSLESEMISGYEMYNIVDRVLNGLMGLPHPRSFDLNDPLGTYCFTEGELGPNSIPGYENKFSFFYDYSPFNNQINRQLGQSVSVNNHVPLKIAVAQEVYSWPIPDYANFVLIKNRIYNASASDTLYDFVIGDFMDADCGPMNSQTPIASDDNVGYTLSDGHEIAFIHDLDFDNGSTPVYIAMSSFLPYENGHRSSWFWRIGDGPDDTRPTIHWELTKRTANEKYWLMSGLNANPPYYYDIRNQAFNSTDQTFLHNQPEDCRFMNSVYGPKPGDPEYSDVSQRWNLAPGQYVDYYSVIMLANDIVSLKNTDNLVRNIVNNHFDPNTLLSMPSYPYLQTITTINESSAMLNWHILGNPEAVQIYWREQGQGDEFWTCEFVSPQQFQFLKTNLQTGLTYEFKIGANFSNSTEPYFSAIKSFVAGSLGTESKPLNQNDLNLNNYPNPFNPNTCISFNLPVTGPVSLKIFNIKGELVKTLVNNSLVKGSHRINWDGFDHQLNQVSSGIYFYQLSTTRQCTTRKMMLIK